MSATPTVSLSYSSLCFKTAFMSQHQVILLLWIFCRSLDGWLLFCTILLGLCVVLACCILLYLFLCVIFLWGPFLDHMFLLFFSIYVFNFVAFYTIRWMPFVFYWLFHFSPFLSPLVISLTISCVMCISTRVLA